MAPGRGEQPLRRHPRTAPSFPAGKPPRLRGRAQEPPGECETRSSGKKKKGKKKKKKADRKKEKRKRLLKLRAGYLYT